MRTAPVADRSAGTTPISVVFEFAGIPVTLLESVLTPCASDSGTGTARAAPMTPAKSQHLKLCRKRPFRQTRLIVVAAIGSPEPAKLTK